MTDAEVVARKLAFVETVLAELRTLVHPDAIARDVVQRRLAERDLQVAIQGALDVASHVVSDERLGEPGSNRELFELLARHGWLDPSLSRSLQAMAGLGNVLVHGHAEVDVAVLKDVVENRLGDLDRFVGSVRTRLSAAP